MKIIHHLPFWWPIVQWRFPAAPKDRVIMAFGPNTYTLVPKIMQDEVAHEEIHNKQQHQSRLYAIWWWWKYLRHDEFRFNQELEAYQVQWRWIQSNNPDKHTNFRHLNNMARELSSAFYGNLCTMAEASKHIDSMVPVMMKDGVIHTFFGTEGEIEMIRQDIPEIKK